MASTVGPARFFLRMSTLVQYIILRKDLLPTKASKGNSPWTWGAIIAQACHASTACLNLYRDDVHVQEYLGDWQSMHKVVLQVGT